MKSMPRKSFRAVALALVAGLAAPAFAGAAPPPEENTRQIVVRSVRGPAKARVVMGSGGRGYLGVQLLDITEELRAFYGAPEDAGILVSRVTGDSPAAAAGFEVGDVITRIAGEPIDSSWEGARTVAQFDPEEEVSVEVIRDGAPVTLTATLGERPGAVWFSRGDGPGLEEFHFEMPGIEQLEALREIPEALDINEETREAMREAFETARERMSAFDLEKLTERLAATEARLRELEQKLAERQR